MIQAPEFKRACIHVLIEGKGAEMIDWLKKKQYPDKAPFTAFFVELLKKMLADNLHAPTADFPFEIQKEAEKFHTFIRQNSIGSPVEKVLNDFIGFNAFTAIDATGIFLQKRKGRIK